MAARSPVSAKPNDITSDQNNPTIHVPHPNEESCRLCSHQSITFSGNPYDIGKADAAFKRRLFHEDCQDCSLAKHQSHPKLCIQCEHLRLRHMLLCYPTISYNNNQGTVISIDPFREGYADCELCNYVATCLLDHCAYTKNNRDVMVNCGTFSLELPKLRGGPLRLGPMSKYIHVNFTSQQAVESSRPPESDVLLSEYANWPVIHHWISTQPQASQQEGTLLPYLGKKLQDLRVINVTRSCIQHLPSNSSFVALSYVWGREPAGQFQTIQDNIHDLGKEGSLANVNLPRTITDAMTTCRKLGQRYLWVDRLCIIQDSSPDQKTIQLNQMGAIYRQATFTIAALAGDGATHGLPGVTKSRLSAQKTLKFGDFDLVESTPALQSCLGQSIWQTRGWTYQEAEASTSILYFTDFGVYFHCRHIQPSQIRAEGPAQVSTTMMDEECYLERVATYTMRCLTYPTDILRAFTGILHGMYDTRTVYGMPWNTFDRAILWESMDYSHKSNTSTVGDIFPSWSWLSASGRIHFRDAVPRGCGLALWGMVTTNNTSSAAVSFAEPDESDEALFNGNQQPLQTQIVAALAWQHGCVQAEIPDYLLVNCSRWPYGDRLEQHWPNYITYWQKVFGSYKARNVFSARDIEVARTPGRIMVYTQKASFSLEWIAADDFQSKTSRPGRNAFLIRSSNGMVAGGIYLSDHWAEEYRTSPQTKATFIVLSTSQYPGTTLMSDILGEHSEHLDLSTLYGCKCSKHSNSLVMSPENQGSVSLEHVASCPQHPHFPNQLPFQPWPLQPRRGVPGPEVRIMAFAKHLAEQSYFDSKGQLLHRWDDVPALNVLMLGPGETNDVGVARRIGLGRIYLRRWAEVRATFETVILE